MYVRKLMKEETIFGYDDFLKRIDFSSIYRQLLDTSLHSIYIVNEQNQILSTSDPSL